MIVIKEYIKDHKKTIALMIYGVLSFPWFWGIISNGLDDSWIYALNKITELNNIKFGRDVVFTYGPLGFLYAPMYTNQCYLYALIIYIILFLGQLLLIKSLIDSGHVSFGRLTIVIFLAFYSNLCGRPDRYIQYCFLMALAAMWKKPGDIFSSLYYILTTIVAFYFKFSIAISAIGVTVIFFVSELILKRNKRIWMILIPIAAIPIIYLIYNPSIIDFLRFIKGSWNISTGYNSAMTMQLYDKYVYLMIVLIVLYIIILLLQIGNPKKDNFFLMLWLSPALFMSYKHMYVRAGGDSLNYYGEIISELVILVLLFDFDYLIHGLRKDKRIRKIQAGLMASFVLFGIVSYETTIDPWNALYERFHGFSASIYYLNEEQYEKRLKSISSVPKQYIETIGDASFTSYPWEISFIEPMGEQSLNYIPLFTLQAYSTYTDYLDDHSAYMLRQENAPEYMLLTFTTIDSRLPFIEAPATWKAIMERYELIDFDNNSYCYLLKRKKNSIVKIDNANSHIIANKTDLIDCLDYDEMRIDAKLNTLGALAKLFWKIPEVDMEITYSNGTVKRGRILLDLLINGVPIKGLPYDYDTIQNSLCGDGSLSTISTIKLYGDGLQFYDDKIEVQFVNYQ